MGNVPERGHTKLEHTIDTRTITILVMLSCVPQALPPDHDHHHVIPHPVTSHPYLQTCTGQPTLPTLLPSAKFEGLEYVLLGGCVRFRWVPSCVLCRGPFLL